MPALKAAPKTCARASLCAGSPGERIVIEPYTREMFERTHRWMESWQLFDATTAARPRYEDAVVA